VSGVSAQATSRPNSSPTATERTTRLVEVAVVIAIAVGHSRFGQLVKGWEFIVPALLLGAVYLDLSVARGGRTLASYGITGANLRASAAWSAVIVGIVLAAGLIITSLANRPVPSDFWLLLAVYPVWGFAQQFMVQGVFHENLLRLGVPASWAIAATTALFALAHHPTSRLMYISAAGGLAFSALFARFRNIVPLGVAHGLCGAVVYHLILHRDPLQRFF
jgi:Type II CAAX prenyl endopeptidase Rce1-like